MRGAEGRVYGVNFDAVIKRISADTQVRVLDVWDDWFSDSLAVMTNVGLVNIPGTVLRQHRKTLDSDRLIRAIQQAIESLLVDPEPAQPAELALAEWPNHALAGLLN